MSAPTPVLPAAAHPPPATALDPVAGSGTGIEATLGKLVNQAGALAQQGYQQAKPLVAQGLAAAKPYSDAAVQKTQELLGTQHHQTIGAGQPTAIDPRSIDPNAPHTMNAEHIQAGTTAPKSVLGYMQAGLAQAQSTLTQVGQVIESKTTTDKHPGILTQIQDASVKALNKADELLGSKPAANTLGPNPPITTTTNTMPH